MATPLFRHFPVKLTPWDETAAIDRFDADNFWPTHPMDDGVEDGATCIYFGAAGVIWALDYLKRCGAVSHGRDFTRILPMLLERNIEWFGKGIYPRHGSLLMGDLGVHLVAMRLAPRALTAEAVYARASANTIYQSANSCGGFPARCSPASTWPR